MEFELMKYGFSGARIFFRDSDVKKKDEAEVRTNSVPLYIPNFKCL